MSIESEFNKSLIVNKPSPMILPLLLTFNLPLIPSHPLSNLVSLPSLKPKTYQLLPSPEIPVKALLLTKKTSILDKVKSTKDSVTSFKTGVTDERISADADNSFRYLSVI